VPQHLREAAQRRHDQATGRAATALARLSATGAAVSFASVAREADLSTDFLYRQPQLRQRIQQMRTPINRTVSAVDSESGTRRPNRPLSVPFQPN
jgi:predicted Zn-dependent protease